MGNLLQTAGAGVAAFYGAGMCRIDFSVADGTVGIYDIIVDTDSIRRTVLYDKDGDAIAYEAHDGSIEVLADGSMIVDAPKLTIVPEPAACTLLSIGGLALLRRRRRR